MHAVNPSLNGDKENSIKEGNMTEDEEIMQNEITKNSEVVVRTADEFDDIESVDNSDDESCDDGENYDNVTVPFTLELRSVEVNEISNADATATTTITAADASHRSDENTNTRTTRYNLRPNCERNYSNRLNHVMDNPASTKSYDVQLLQTALHELTQTGYTKNTMKIIAHFIFTQMTVKAGIRKHSEPAVNALYNELF